jgi:membrane-associated protease RseP (regulator of RpoE activity)
MNIPSNGALQWGAGPFSPIREKIARPVSYRDISLSIVTELLKFPVRKRSSTPIVGHVKKLALAMQFARNGCENRFKYRI